MLSFRVATRCAPSEIQDRKRQHVSRASCLYWALSYSEVRPFARKTTLCDPFIDHHAFRATLATVAPSSSEQARSSSFNASLHHHSPLTPPPHLARLIFDSILLVRQASSAASLARHKPQPKTLSKWPTRCSSSAPAVLGASVRIDELDAEAKIPELAEAAIAKAKADKLPVPIKKTPRGIESDPTYGVRYSIFGGSCSDIEAVRKHMDSGVLASMIARLQQGLRPAEVEESSGPDPNYTIVLLGACAMTLGCTLPTGFKHTIIA